MSNIRSRVAKLEKSTVNGNVYVEAAGQVREANELFWQFRIDDRVSNDRPRVTAAEIRRRLQDDSLPGNERRLYMQVLQRMTSDEVERQTIQAKLTQMDREEIKALRRQAEEKGLSKRSRETLLKIADGCERVLRRKVGISPGTDGTLETQKGEIIATRKRGIDPRGDLLVTHRKREQRE